MRLTTKHAVLILLACSIGAWLWADRYKTQYMTGTKYYLRYDKWTSKISVKIFGEPGWKSLDGKHQVEHKLDWDKFRPKETIMSTNSSP